MLRDGECLGFGDKRWGLGCKYQDALRHPCRTRSNELVAIIRDDEWEKVGVIRDGFSGLVLGGDEAQAYRGGNLRLESD